MADVCNEVALLLHVQQGTGDYETFYHYYRKWLLIAATAILQHEQEAEELVQEFFIDCWEQRLVLRIPATSRDAIRNYLFISIRNRCLNRMAVNDTRRRRLAMLTGLLDDYQAPENRLESRELGRSLEDAIEQLPPRQGSVFRSAYQHDKSRREIAVEMNISEKTVKKQMQLALKNLRTLLRHLH
ncbi:RNA polymerase sigma-70 factor [Chitinophaga caseinilytica]|uniref:RNA polymerase sigma-70 factor n=1 Tax=Chitinophaga caseinilytica TaxID=2267521 RepID=A0ABZ2Z3Y3_9BACT